MERITLEAATVHKAVSKAVRVLKNGGVILYPTDTLYGLGADAFSNEAVDKVYAIKGREEKKPTHCIVADMEMTQRYAEVTDDARLLAERFFPGALTLILKKKAGVAGGIARGLDTLGVRIPDNEFCLSLARAFGRPFTGTSANISGLPPERSALGILAQLGSAAEGIDLIVDASELAPSAPSSVVDLSKEEPAILREGAVSAADVWDAIRLQE